MALYIISKNDLSDVIANSNNVIYFSSPEVIQEKFCSYLEFEDEDNGISFFSNEFVKKYLDHLGLIYNGNYKIGSYNWYGSGDANSEVANSEIEWRFVTFLSYCVQAAIVMLYCEESTIVCETTAALDEKYSPFALKQRDVYYVYDDIDYDFVLDYVKADVDVYLYGEYLNVIPLDELYNEISDKEYSIRYLTRELDAEVFPDDYKSNVFNKYKTSLVDYAIRKGVQCLDDIPTDITVLVNSDTFTSDLWRRYPLHQLFEYKNQWYYRATCSVKNPDYGDMLGEISFWLDDTEIEESDIVRNASKMLTLVLDCNEICDARRYWEHVGFVSVYNRDDRTLEICDKAEGIAMFHELLQSSVDLDVK